MRARSGSLLRRAAALLLAGAAALWPAPALTDEPKRVVCTLPHIGALAREVGGERVTVDTLCRPDQDPHFVQATPGLMVKANQAAMYFELGLELELWSEPVLDGARNQNVRVGSPGHLFAATNVPVLERPAVISRAQGDVHPNGNPHIWLHPLNAVIEARNIALALARNDAAHAADYEARGKALQEKIRRAYFGDALYDLLGADTLEKLQRNEGLHEFLEKRKYKGEPLVSKLGGWLGKMEPFRGRKVITFHRDMSYFQSAFGVEVAATLEPKAGVAPSPGHLSDLEEAAKATPFAMVMCTPYQNVGLAESFAKRIGVPFRELQIDCALGQDYVALMDAVTGAVAETISKGGEK